MGILARWTWWRWVLTRGVGLLGAVWWLARALGNLMPRLPAAATLILGIWPLRGPLQRSGQLLLLLMQLSLGSHEGFDYF